MARERTGLSGTWTKLRSVQAWGVKVSNLDARMGMAVSVKRSGGSTCTMYLERRVWHDASSSLWTVTLKPMTAPCNGYGKSPLPTDFQPGDQVAHRDDLKHPGIVADTVFKHTSRTIKQRAQVQWWDGSITWVDCSTLTLAYKEG